MIGAAFGAVTQACELNCGKNSNVAGQALLEEARVMKADGAVGTQPAWTEAEVKDARLRLRSAPVK